MKGDEIVSILSKFKLEKTAIISGAARGLARTMANGLAEAGVNIIIPDIDVKQAEITAKKISKIGVKSLALKADVIDEKDVINMVSKTIDEFSHIDILVNNAGIFKHISTEKMSKED